MPSNVLEAIAEPTRRRILDAVHDEERSVGDLVEIVGMHQPGVSRHLKVLRDAGLVEVRPDAQRRLYRLRAEPLRELDAWLEPYREQMSAHLDSLERHLERTAADQEQTREKGAAMSASPTGTVERTPEGGRVRFERLLAFPIEEVRAAITEPERLGDWWPPMAADITVDLREQGKIVVSPGSWMRWELEPTEEGTRLRATYSVPDLDMAIERGDLVGLHYSLDRLVPALSGEPVPWGNEAFMELATAYAELSPAEPKA